ncbi:aldolase [Edwardsiella piscicida]|uniref:3-oxo-tetronate 4-phosphate decarboxylase n=1 Tax=Edwardsiella piscicida TaxID=1263550 RepID=UPI00370D87D8
MTQRADAMQTQRTEMVQLAASLFQRGYATGAAGNLSLRLADGSLLATPTGASLGRLSPPRLSHLSADGVWRDGDRPTKELPFHLALYQNSPRCQAVVHLHSPWCTALSCLEGLDPRSAIRPMTPYLVMRVGDVPVVPYHRPGDARLADALAALAPNHRAFLLANHGVVTYGDSLQEAVNNAEELEATARLVFILARHPVRYLSAEHIAQLRS